MIKLIHGSMGSLPGMESYINVIKYTEYKLEKNLMCEYNIKNINIILRRMDS